MRARKVREALLAVVCHPFAPTNVDDGPRFPPFGDHGEVVSAVLPPPPRLPKVPGKGGLSAAIRSAQSFYLRNFEVFNGDQERAAAAAWEHLQGALSMMEEMARK